MKAIALPFFPGGLIVCRGHTISLPKFYTMDALIAVMNQVFEISKKLEEDNLSSRFERNFNKLNNIFEEEGFICNNPLGEKYTDARTDCTASIAGAEGRDMVITQVIKPVIYQRKEGALSLVQKGIVIVERKK